jgi:hypothetical protein
MNWLTLCIELNVLHKYVTMSLVLLQHDSLPSLEEGLFYP